MAYAGQIPLSTSPVPSPSKRRRIGNQQHSSHSSYSLPQPQPQQPVQIVPQLPPLSPPACPLPFRQGFCDDITIKYDLLFEVGEGTYGIVYKAEAKSTARTKCAIKKFRATKDGEGISLTACREIGVQSKVNTL